MEDDDFYRFVALRKEGTDISTIRKMMESEGFSEEQIQKSIAEIEDEILQSSPSKSVFMEPKMLAGVLLCLLGFSTILFGFFGILNLIIIFAGVAIMSVKLNRTNGKINTSKWRRH